MTEMCPVPECTEDGAPDPGPLTEARLARIAKGMSHPMRVRILAQFVDHRPRTVNEVVAGCALAQSTVSEHLRIMRDADLVFARRDGPRTWYCVRRSVLSEFTAAVDCLAITELTHAG